MPGAGHNHSAKFERLLRHLKDQGYSAARAHKIAYSSGVGKAFRNKACKFCLEDMEDDVVTNIYKDTVGSGTHGAANATYSEAGILRRRKKVTPQANPRLDVDRRRAGKDPDMRVKRKDYARVRAPGQSGGGFPPNSPAKPTVTVPYDPKKTPPKKTRVAMEEQGPGETGGQEEPGHEYDSVYSSKECPQNFDVQVLISEKGILQKDADETRHIAGWASVEIVDRHGEMISMDAFTDDVLRKFMERTGGRIYLAHQDIPIGKITTVERKSMPDGALGLWLEADLYHMDSIDDGVWKAVVDGRISGFSIKGRAMRKETQCTADLCYAYIPEVELYAVSAVEKPANQASTIHAIAASDDNNLTLSTAPLMTKTVKKSAPIKKWTTSQPTGPQGDRDARLRSPQDATRFGKQDEDKEDDVQDDEKDDDVESDDGGDDQDGDAVQGGQKPAGGQYVQSPDAPVGDVPTRLANMEATLAGLTEAMKKLAPGTQAAAMQAAAMADGMSRKDDDVESEDDVEEEDDVESEDEVEEATKGDMPPEEVGKTSAVKKQEPAGGQYVEKPAKPSGLVPGAMSQPKISNSADDVEAMKKELADLRKQLAAQPVSMTRAAPLTVGPVSEKGATVPEPVRDAINKRLNGTISEKEFTTVLGYK